MREKYNLKSVIAGLVLIIAGISLTLLDHFLIKSGKAIFISVGCSLLASGMVILVQAWLVEVKRYDYAQEWGLTKIYKNKSRKKC